jgi:HSP20 family protein
MLQVAVEKIVEKKASTASAVHELKSLSEQVRQRAFEIFERRGGVDGFAMNDWLNAERDLFRIPDSELVEQDGKFEARVSVPGLEPDDVHVTALPDTLVVKASSTHRHDKVEGDIRFCEFDQKTLFRRFDLPEPIDVDKVTAKLEKGVLQLTALKSKQEAGHKQRSEAA